MLNVLLFSLTLLLIYIYFGYPVLLGLLARICSKWHPLNESFEPRVSLVISAYNEVSVIEKKIENTLSLEYPKEKMKIWVISDASTDGTDDIVKSYEQKGVMLLSQKERHGKTAGINQALSCIDSEIVIFSDANAMYDANVVRRLVRHFADQKVGYAVGYARYSHNEKEPSEADRSESVYWDLEVRIKKWESDLNSVVGGDGAIYAIRRSLYQPLQDSDINDFVNPLQIVVQGYRGIFDPEAFCVENPAGKFDKEFRRKVRIVNRSFNGILRVPQSCNPFRVGWFAWQLISHKLLRWFSPFFLLAHFMVTLFFTHKSPLWPVPVFFLGGYWLLAALSLWGCWREKKNLKNPPILYFPLYFFLINFASVLGILLRLKGETITTWQTVRGHESLRAETKEWLSGCLLISGLILFVSFGRIYLWLGPLEWLLKFLVIVLLVGLFYVYLGYPLLLGILAGFFKVSLKKDDNHFPSVTLLIAAFNEEKVIRDKLLNSLELDYPQDMLRIVVASDGSTDGTEDIVREFAPRGVELQAFRPNRGKISVLNDAMRLIDAEIVVFSDANVMFEPDAVRKLVRNFADSRVGGVSGKVILQQEQLSYAISEKRYYDIEHFIQEKEGESGGLIGADGAMYAIRRNLFVEPRPNTILDDFVISMEILRQGYLLVFEKEAVAYEDNLTEISGEFQRKARIIAGGIQCLRTGQGVPGFSDRWILFKFVSHKVLRWFSGVMALLLFLCLLVLHYSGNGLSPPLAAAALASVSVLAGIGLAAYYLPCLRKTTIANFIFYFFMLNLASLLGCYKGWTGKQKVTWKST